ncbi:MAG: DUF1573 domain-containing protein [Planctomycetes bacterium]|nr:DUF1573 domain-containing protein [Planctomycetota bacterium]
MTVSLTSCTSLERAAPFLLLLVLLGGCGDRDPAPAAGTAAAPAAVRPQAGDRLKQLPDRAQAPVPEEGPFRFHDRETRPTARDVAWLLLKASRQKSVSREKVGVELVGSLKGVSFGHLKRFFESLGLRPRAVEEPLAAFLLRDTPGVLAMKPVNPALPEWACSFLLFRGLTPDGKLEVTDPLTGAHVVDEAALAERYLGAAFYLEEDATGPLLEEADIGVDEIHYSYDRVDAGTLVRKTFRIFNRGAAPLKILGIRPTCGCLATPLHEKGAKVADPRATFKRNPDTGVWEIDFVAGKLSTVIAPHGEVYVTGFYDTTNRIGRQPTSFTVVFSDPDEPELTFVVEGFVTQVAQFDPPVLHWPEIRSAEGARAHIWLRSTKGRDFAIERIEFKNDHLAVALDPDAPREAAPVTFVLPRAAAPRAHPAADGWQALEVRVKPGAPVGPFNTVIQLSTDLTSSPLAFGAWGTVKGNVVVEPTLASFGRVQLGVQATALVRIHSIGPEPFRVTEAVVSQPRLMDVALREEAPGVYVVELALRKGWQAPSLQGQLTVRTNDSLEPVVHVEVTGFVQR